MQKPILYLVGFMGAGKTAVGKALGELLGYSVIDTDEMIEEQEKLTIKEIFEQYGEEYFRKRESEVLREISQEVCIVTTGGGIILDEKNRQYLKESGRAVFLRCHPEVIAARLEEDETRPLIMKKTVKEIAEMYMARLPLYVECTTIDIDTTHQSIETVAKEVASRMNMHVPDHTSI